MGSVTSLSFTPNIQFRVGSESRQQHGDQQRRAKRRNGRLTGWSMNIKASSAGWIIALRQ
jgi:hypothetical protein